jgi:hypothetical protein
LTELAYFLWLLTRDERVLKFLCIGCLVLAALCYSRAGVSERHKVAAYDRVQLTSDARLVSP